VSDHPALARAAADADHVVPLFVLDDAILTSSFNRPNRTGFLLESLSDLSRGASVDDIVATCAILLAQCVPAEQRAPTAST